jgi:hypothetical protein
MPSYQGCANVSGFHPNRLENVVNPRFDRCFYIGKQGDMGMARLKLTIEKDGCHAECDCGDCGYVYQEYEVA